MIKDFASDFVEKEIKSLASDIDRNSMFSAEFVKKLFDFGFMEHFVPENMVVAVMKLGIEYALLNESLTVKEIYDNSVGNQPQDNTGQ